jgi:hypothetical protein
MVAQKARSPNAPIQLRLGMTVLPVDTLGQPNANRLPAYAEGLLSTCAACAGCDGQITTRSKSIAIRLFGNAFAASAKTSSSG